MGFAGPVRRCAGGLQDTIRFESYTAAVAEGQRQERRRENSSACLCRGLRAARDPEGIRAQVEGAAIYGLSAAFARRDHN